MPASIKHLNRCPTLGILTAALMAMTLAADGSLASESQPLGAGADRSPEIAQLFQQMGIVQMPAGYVPADFSLQDLNGDWVQLSDFKGKIVLINFWATWCPNCREEMPALEKLHQRFKDRDFVLIAIDLQEPAEVVRAYIRKYKLTFKVLLDDKGDVGRQFGLQAIPTTFILDKSGMVIGAALGSRTWDNGTASNLFEALMAAPAAPKDDSAR